MSEAGSSYAVEDVKITARGPGFVRGCSGLELIPTVSGVNMMMQDHLVSSLKISSRAGTRLARMCSSRHR
jgi:hypothetical protein